VFVHKRKLKMQPKELAYTKDLSDLNTKFWDFDNLLISKI